MVDKPLLCILASIEAVISDSMITCIILVYHMDASISFDPGSIYSCVSSCFACYSDMPHDSFDIFIYVPIPVGESIMVDLAY